MLPASPRRRYLGSVPATPSRPASVLRLPIRLLGALLGLLTALAPLAAGPVEDGRALLETLKRELRAEAPAARVRALDEFARAAPRLPTETRRAAARLLRPLLAEEADPVVRGAVVPALARLQHPEAWVGVILAAREDADADVRLRARRAVYGGGADLLALAAKLLREDEDPTFRADLLLLLGRRGREDAVPLLLAGLRDPHPRVVAAAAEALEGLCGLAVGYGAEDWVRALEARPPAAAPAPTAPGATVAPVADDPPEPPPVVTRGLQPEFLGLTLSSKDLVFVVDISGSVGPGAIDATRRALERAVDRLGSDVRFTALFFAEEVSVFRPALVPATPRAKEDLHLFLRGLAAGRRSDVYTPVNMGLELVKKRLEEKQRAGEPVREAVTLVVVSDGRDNVARTPPQVIAERLERLDVRHAVVHALVLGAQDHPFMRALAQRTGGHYLPVAR